jgi:hypothetical protein
MSRNAGFECFTGNVKKKRETADEAVMGVSRLSVYARGFRSEE